MQPYLVVVEELQAWLLSIDCVPVDAFVAKRVAIWLVNAGFKNWAHLVGLEADDLQSSCASEHASDRALLRRAILQAESLSVAATQTASTSSSGSASSRPVVVNAAAAAANLQPEMLHAAEAAWVSEVEKLGVTGLATELRPAQAIEALAAARRLGQDIHPCLNQRVAFLKYETQRRSLPSVVCGLKSWHLFATLVCGYHESCTLPPRNDSDVMKYLSIFRNAGTGSNYISYVR